MTAEPGPTTPPLPAPAPSDATAQPRQPTGWRKWVFRLAAMTLVPAAILGLFELTLRWCGYGYPTNFFIQRPELTGPDWYVANDDFGRRFFPPGLIRPPLPLKFSVAKPSNTQRIFVLGESAARGFPDPSSSFPRFLEVMLRDQYPDRHFKVINTAMVAINSNTILPIARECTGYEPDLFIVFMGNNEVVGPFGAAGVIGAYSPSLPLIRANLAVKTTRTGQLLHDAAQWLNPNRTPAQGWEGMATFQHSRVRADDPHLGVVYDHFEQNLRGICRTGNGAGAKVILCTVPVNLKESAPFTSLHAADLSDDALARWQRIYDDGVRLESAKQCSEAASRYAEASQIDDQYADLHYRWGRCLLAMNKPAEARAKYLAAREFDVLRFRADKKINETIRTVAEAERASLVDADDIFARNSADGVPGEDFFLEHVHMNTTGNHLLARSICEKILSLDKPARATPILTEEQCAHRLAHTGWNRYAVATQVVDVINQPPFTTQLDHAERNLRWQKTIEGLRDDTKPAALKQAVAEYEQVLRERPDDWMIAMNFGVLLTQMNDLDRAAHQYAIVAKHEPQIFSARIQLGQLAMRMRHLTEAKSLFEAVLKFDPENSEAHYGLADVLVMEGAVESAREIYLARIKRDPVPAQAWEKMARFYARQRKFDDAKACLDQALALSPDNASVHANMGDAYMALNQPEGARKHYEAALRLRPGWPEMIDRLKKPAPK